MKNPKIVSGLSVLTLVLFCMQSYAFAGSWGNGGETTANSFSEDVEVTIYNSNLGVVKENRFLDLKNGLNTHLFEGVASAIDPTSVKLNSLDGSFEVLEQNYQYDLVSKSKILEKYVGKRIQGFKVVGDAKELVEGTLLSFSGSELIIRKDGGEIQIASVSDMILPDLPRGLITKPTLEWMINSVGAGKKNAELSYMTSGMSWSADYVVVTNPDDSKMDLNGWVTITNNAGATFENASLKLVAGDVNRIMEPSAMRYDMVYATEANIGGAQFAQEQLFEYHMYDLQRKTTLRNNEQKQISLLSASEVGVEKEYVYEGYGTWYRYGSDNTKVQVKLNFDNSEGNGLGIPLPKGRIRVFKEDGEGRLQFVGEDSVDHTPKDETIRVLMGNAFDIVGERKQTNVRDLGCQHEVSWEITLRNHKDEDVVVTVLENAYWDWEITRENYKHVKESNQLIKWSVPVKKDGESKLEYTIRYNNC
ncbi:MAG TPA: DUF4139 domain-containing protein [Candidatus Altiarchaeales archaeon]|nr:DUF4139 domain-containing protein [Candidatus Altiarchaeales archaeon]